MRILMENTEDISQKPLDSNRKKIKKTLQSRND